MSNRVSVVLAVLAVLVGGSSAAAAATAPMVDEAQPSVLQQDVNKLREIGTVGVLAATVNGAESARARAGVAERGTTKPVPWGSHVRLGSTTKAFVATVILQLEDEGRLSLDDSVERWLPGVVQGRGNQGEHMTIRNLLQHTSGLFDYVGDEAFISTLLTPESFIENRFNTYAPEQLIAIAVSHPPDFAPGAKWSYSSTNYIVAGQIIKAVTGQSWDVEVKKRIIAPLGLGATSEPGTDPGLPSPFSRGYELFGTDGVYTETTLHNMTWGGAAGSLISTPEDINRFFMALMKGQLLSPQQLAKMRTTVPMGPDYEDIWPGAAYGLGLIRINLPCGGVYWGHGGDVIGYSITNGVTPSGERSATVASTTNTLADPVFADNSIQYTYDLVEHALCAAGPSSATLN
ncbi:MAG: serine hydrolase domain-containing protein [Pseudonocardiaceae bacterium]